MYAVDFDPVADKQVDNLPERALTPLLELLSVLELAPWSGRSLNPGDPNANMLTHTFGETGLATYLVLERDRLVYITRIAWL